MAHTKIFIFLAALAVIVGQATTSTYSPSRLRELKRTCRGLLITILGLDKLNRDEQKTFEFAKNWIGQNSAASSDDIELIKAWEAVSKNYKCSDSSWEHVVLLSSCGANVLDVVKEPLKVYASMCLTPVSINKKVKSASYMSKISVDFINEDFIHKYLEDNPHEPQLHVDSKPLFKPINDLFSDWQDQEDANCCEPDRSKGALVQAVEKSLAGMGKEQRKEFKWFGGKEKRNNKLYKFLKEKLMKPCKEYFEAMRPLEAEILAVSSQYEGGQQALLKTLDQEARNVLFRYRYCAMLGQTGTSVISEVVEQFSK